MTRLLLVLLLLAAGCGGGADDTAGDDAVPAETEIAAEWSLNAVEFRDRIGDRIAYTCPAGGPVGALWGTDPYTDDSSVCTAGVHAGVITVEDGGRVVIEIGEGLESYDAGEANGVSAAEWPDWPGSFSVVGAS
jgi:hypothetical protein